LLAAIESVMQDTSWLGQRIVEKLANLTKTGGGSQAGLELESMSVRAKEVLSMVAKGRTDEEIAEKLGISRNTVRNHIAAIFKATGVHRRTAVVVWARERGFGIQDKPRTTPTKRDKHRRGRSI
jgi:DNA-binding NarL/FixJ family response regulator